MRFWPWIATLRVWTLASGLALAGTLGCRENTEKYWNSYLGKAPPELSGAPGQWIHASRPLRLADFSGKVVWLEFGSLACACCRDMDPVLRDWQARLAPRGLVIIGVGSGKDDRLDQLKEAMESNDQKHAALWDEEERNCAAYGILGFPVGYLIGVDGKVLWEGAPCMKAKEIETLISAELGRIPKAAP